MGVILCSTHGRQIVTTCCPHVASTPTGAGVASEIVSIAFEAPAMRELSWGFQACRACAARLRALAPDGRASEPELDALDLRPVCGACLREVGPEPAVGAVYLWREEPG